MDKILHAGAAGSLGLEVVKKLANSNIPFRALASNPESAETLKPYTTDVWIADARDPDAIKGLCDGISIVVSSLGKSVSLFTKDEGNYDEIDYDCNRNIIAESCNVEVRRFIYCSIKGSDSATELKLAEVHHKVQELLAKSLED